MHLIKIAREFEATLLKRLSESGVLMQAVVGQRQVGKTTGVQAIAAQWTGPKVIESAESLQRWSEVRPTRQG